MFGGSSEAGDGIEGMADTNTNINIYQPEAAVFTKGVEEQKM